MREIRLSGSVEGVVSNHDPYSDLRSAWKIVRCKNKKPTCQFVSGGGLKNS